MEGIQFRIWELLMSASVLFPDNKDVSVMMSEMDVNAIAGTLKLYFRELPEPLFTDEFYPNFAEGIGEHRRRHPLPSCPLSPPTMACVSARTLVCGEGRGGPRIKPVLEGLCSSSRGLLLSPSLK